MPHLKNSHRFAGTITLSLTLPMAILLCLLVAGCPHRSPVWSPDGTRILLLGGTDGEKMESPASRLWLLPQAASEAIRLAVPPQAQPPPPTRFLAVAWLDNATFVVLTTRWTDDAAIEDSQAIWRVSDSGSTWTRVTAPPPSPERSMRRNPAVTRNPDGKAVGLAYASGDEGVVVINVSDGKVLTELATAEMVGPDGSGGFLVYQPNDDTGGIDLIDIGPDMKKRWTRPFSSLTRDIAAFLGSRQGNIVFNDASTSVPTSIPGRDGQTVGVNLVFTDVSWNDGVQGYHAVLTSREGSLVAVSGAMGLPGRPSTLHVAASKTAWTWAVSPTTRRNVETGSIRARPLRRGSTVTSVPPGADLKLEGIAKSAIHGYGLSPDGKEFCVVVNGLETRLLFYAVDGGKVLGRPREVVVK